MIPPYELENLLRAAQQVNEFASKNAHIFEILRRAIEEAARAAEVLAEEEREKQQITPFVENDLCLAPSMPAELVEEIHRRHKDGQSVVEYVSGWYHADNWRALSDMVDPWEKNNYYKSRMHIIREALWTHQQGRYTASIATLIPQIEGLVWDWAFGDDAVEQVLRKERERKKKRKQRTASDDDGEFGLSDYETNLVTAVVGMLPATSLTRGEWTCMRSFVNFCNSLLYQPYRASTDHARLIDSTELSRHAFAHGTALAIGTEANSLRLFFALDVLSLIRE